MSFRAAFLAVPPEEREAWIDEFLGVGDPLPADGPALQPGNVPYMPCGVETLLAVIEHARITERDVFVDVGCGLGRAAAFVHLMTGASAIGVEVQPHLAGRARELARRSGARVDVIEGDATRLAGALERGTVFFLYCPFSGERLNGFVGELEPIARAHPIRICAVDVPLPRRAWLEPVHESAHLVICRSTSQTI